MTMRIHPLDRTSIMLVSHMARRQRRPVAVLECLDSHRIACRALWLPSTQISLWPYTSPMSRLTRWRTQSMHKVQRPGHRYPSRVVRHDGLPNPLPDKILRTAGPTFDHAESHSRDGLLRGDKRPRKANWSDAKKPECPSLCDEIFVCRPFVPSFQIMV